MEVSQEVEVHVKELNTYVVVTPVEGSPAMSSLGRLCDDMGSNNEPTIDSNTCCGDRTPVVGESHDAEEATVATALFQRVVLIGVSKHSVFTHFPKDPKTPIWAPTIPARVIGYLAHAHVVNSSGSSQIHQQFAQVMQPPHDSIPQELHCVDVPVPQMLEECVPRPVETHTILQRHTVKRSRNSRQSNRGRNTDLPLSAHGRTMAQTLDQLILFRKRILR